MAIADAFEKQGNSVKAEQLYRSVADSCPDLRGQAQRQLLVTAEKNKSQKPRTQANQVAQRKRPPTSQPAAATAAHTAIAQAPRSQSPRNQTVVKPASATRTRQRPRQEDDSTELRRSTDLRNDKQASLERASERQISQISHSVVAQKDAHRDINYNELLDLIQQLGSEDATLRIDTALTIDRLGLDPRFVSKTLHKAYEEEPSLITRAYLADSILLLFPDDVTAVRDLLTIISSSDAAAAARAGALLQAHQSGKESVVASQLAVLTRDNDPQVRDCAKQTLERLNAATSLANPKPQTPEPESQSKLQK